MLLLLCVYVYENIIINYFINLYNNSLIGLSERVCVVVVDVLVVAIPLNSTPNSIHPK